MRFYVFEIIDEFIRENFRRLDRAFQDSPFLKGQWRFVEIRLAAAVTNYKYPHKLKFVPTDVIETSKTGAGSLTWNYTLFDGDNLNLTTSGACVVRAFVGTSGEII